MVARASGLLQRESDEDLNAEGGCASGTEQPQPEGPQSTRGVAQRRKAAYHPFVR
jgi:hypothetical protein